MKDTIRNLGLSVILSCSGAAWAQQTPPADTPPAKLPQATAQSEAGEPRANTSGPQADAIGAPSTTRPAPAAAAPATTPPAQKPAAQKPTNAKSVTANDKLQLGTSTVTGDREQPKVMYIVPWKKPDIGDAEGKPMNSLVDEILSPVDRDVFKREVRYYQTVKSQAGQNGAPPAAGQLPPGQPPAGQPAAGQVEK